MDPFVEAPFYAELLGVSTQDILDMQQDVLAVTIGYTEGAMLAKLVRREEADGSG